MAYNITCATARGPRPYQEDRFVTLTKGERSLLAVLDGHGGAEVAEHCAERLKTLDMFPETKSGMLGMVQILAAETEDYEAGSTLSLVSVTPEGAIIAVLGDSPIITLDSSWQLRVSPEHNVRTNLAEREATIARGGRYGGGYIWRGDSGLQMSRALGDSHLSGILSREPEIYTITDPHWVLVLSDGVLDPGHAETSELIGDLQQLMETITEPTAQDVLDWAEARGLADNATVVLWRRLATAPISQGTDDSEPMLGTHLRETAKTVKEWFDR